MKLFKVMNKKGQGPHWIAAQSPEKALLIAKARGVIRKPGNGTAERVMPTQEPSFSVHDRRCVRYLLRIGSGHLDVCWRAGEKDGMWTLERYDAGRARMTQRYFTAVNVEPAMRKLRKELDEADRRAGAAERRMEYLQDGANKGTHWLDKAKSDAGYSRNVSFDVVWGAALAALKEHVPMLRSALSALTPSMPPANAMCHVGTVPQAKCAHCQRVAAAIEALKVTEPKEKGK